MPTAQSIRTFFKKNGYYFARGVYRPAEIRAMERDYDRIVRQLARTGELTTQWTGERQKKAGGEKNFITHTHNVQCFSAVWLRAIQSPRLLDIAEAILGPDIILHHTKLIQKPREDGMPFSMHQDWSYFPSVKDTMIAASIHVSAATDEMGCLRVYPGSHKLGRAAHTSGQEPCDLLDQYPLENATVLEAEPGDVLFFHYFTLHGSKHNRSRKLRKNMLVQMHAGDDEIEAGNGHPNARITLRGWNHRMSRAIANSVTT
jgi:phytanoyl-CoA hydroxylase